MNQRTAQKARTLDGKLRALFDGAAVVGAYYDDEQTSIVVWHDPTDLGEYEPTGTHIVESSTEYLGDRIDAGTLMDLAREAITRSIKAEEARKAERAAVSA